MSLSILSFLAIVSILPISFIARDFDWKSGLLLARQLTLPMGLVVTLMLLAKLLGMMGDPSMLYSLLAESMLPSVFALMQYTILSQISSSNSAPHQPWQSIYLQAIVAVVCSTLDFKGFFQTSLLRNIVDAWSRHLGFTLVQLGFHRQKQTIGNLALQIAFECLLSDYTVDSILGGPNNVGPNMASIILGSCTDLSSGCCPSCTEFHLFLTSWASHFIVYDHRHFFLSYAPIVLFSFSIDLWNMNEQTQALNKTDYQHQLLREMAVPKMATLVTSQFLLTNQPTYSSMIN